MNAKELHGLADTEFTKRQPLMSMWQECSEQFSPARADFTYKRYIGTDWAANQMTGWPALCARNLTDSIGTMLRPTAKEWFEMGVTDDSRVGNDERRWLQWATGVQRRAMYDPAALFNKSAKLGDRDFGVFGQCVIQLIYDPEGVNLLYRCYHLRDVCWVENEKGKICCIFRRWKPKAMDLKKYFDGKKSPHGGKRSIAPEVTKMADKTPFEEVDCLHIMCMSDMYDGDDKDATGRSKKKMPWRSIYFDCAHNHEMESVAVQNKQYIIPRWETLGVSQYAYSPATVIALPEARLLQAMTYTLLEAGEKATTPPMVANSQVFREDMSVYAGGISWADIEFDGKIQDHLQIMTNDKSGLQFGAEQQRDSRQLLTAYFYLDKLKPFLPTQDKEMTAYQAGQIVAQYIREALPLFEPMEAEYNGGVCEETFDVLLANGGFGSVEDMPRRLRGADINFRFSSPLHDAIEQQKGTKLMEMTQMFSQIVALDQSVGAIPDWKTAFRDALNGVQIPAKWQNSEAKADAMIEAHEKQQQTQALLANLQAGADIGQTMAAASKDKAAAQATAAAV